MPAVSVIIVNYNARALLIDCVRAVLASTVPVQVLVSDNGPAGGGVTELRDVLGSEPRLSITENGRNLGFARANNVVLPQAQGAYLLFLNPDCLIRADTLERMCEALEAYPEAGMAGCVIRNMDGSVQTGCRRHIPTPWHALVRVLYLHKLFRYNPKFQSFDLAGQSLPALPEPIEAISGAFMLVRRSALIQVGPLDEGYFLHCEDLDWCMRFREAGYTILFVPQEEVIHAKGISSASRPVRVEWHKHRGMARFYRKFFRSSYPTVLNLMVTGAIWTRFSIVVAKLLAKKALHCK